MKRLVDNGVHEEDMVDLLRDNSSVEKRLIDRTMDSFGQEYRILTIPLFLVALGIINSSVQDKVVVELLPSKEIYHSYPATAKVPIEFRH